MCIDEVRLHAAHVLSPTNVHLLFVCHLLIMRYASGKAGAGFASMLDHTRKFLHRFREESDAIFSGFYFHSSSDRDVIIP
jgi:hypothetical protein